MNIRPIFAGLVIIVLCACQTPPVDPDDPRARTKRGATIGAIAGAVAGVFVGDGEADEILGTAAIGAGLGAGIGLYMDKQQERLEQIEEVSVERLDEETLRVKFDSDILFQVDSAVLNESSRQSLNDFARVMMDYPKTAIVVMGYTDSTGEEAYNQKLSERRANAVRNHLISREVQPDRMTAIGFGESNPVADNDTSAGRALNRRVSILVKGKA